MPRIQNIHSCSLTVITLAMAITEVGSSRKRKAFAGSLTICKCGADMINGWDVDILQRAVNQCTNDSGNIEDCDVLDLQELNTEPYTDSPVCRKSHSVDEVVTGVLAALPGNNPIQSGPDDAQMSSDENPPDTFKNRTSPFQGTCESFRQCTMIADREAFTAQAYSGNVARPGVQQPDNVPVVKMSANGFTYKGC